MQVVKQVDKHDCCSRGDAEKTRLPHDLQTDGYQYLLNQELQLSAAIRESVDVMVWFL